MSISAADLLAQIEAGHPPVILDVRSRREFEKGHVPGARHMPFWAVSMRHGDIPGSRTDPIVIYCGHGPRAALAASLLRRAGFQRLEFLEGHMSGWISSQLPQQAGPSQV